MLMSEHSRGNGKSERHQHYEHSSRKSVCEHDGADNHQPHSKPDIRAWKYSRRMKWRDDKQHQSKQNREDRKERVTQALLEATEIPSCFAVKHAMRHV
jgi:hypothetical protein